MKVIPSGIHVVILGCGFTGTRVSRLLLSKGAEVTAAGRDPKKLSALPCRVTSLEQAAACITPGALVLHSVPPQGSSIVAKILENKPARVVYLSSTGVYGRARLVDETTPADPTDEQAEARLRDEAMVAGGPWSSLILRPAAIYGPFRGAHDAVRRGAYHPGDNFVSRIHVDDLATHVEAALLSGLTGAFPVADEYPCPAREIGEYCAGLLRVPLANNENERIRRASRNRRVDGSAIRRLLGITLAYPSYREGIPASIQAEIASSQV